jgi:hypothetical protein
MHYSTLKWKTLREEDPMPGPGGWREAEVSVELPIRPRGASKNFESKVKIGTPIRSGKQTFTEAEVTKIAKDALEVAARRTSKWYDDLPEDKRPMSAEVGIRFRKELLALMGLHVPGSRVNS